MYKKGPDGWLKHLDFMLLNGICLHVSFVLAYMLRHGYSNPYYESKYRSLILIMTLLEIIIAIFFSTFKNVLKRGYYKEFAMTLKHVVLLELLTAFYLFSIQEGEEISRIILYLIGFFYFLISYAAHIAWKSFIKKEMTEREKRSLVIITVEGLAEIALQNIQDSKLEMFYIQGLALLNKNLVGETIAGVPVVAFGETVIDFISKNWVDEVFIKLPEKHPYPDNLINQLTEMGVVVHIKITKASNTVGQKQFIERIGNYTVLTTSMNYANPAELFTKRFLDVVGGLIGTFLTGILFIILAPLIYWESPGPIFFSQTRIGKNGKPFKIHKFRSMYMDAEERKEELLKFNKVSDGMMFKLEWDPRIIGCKKMSDGSVKRGIGNIIREWSLDEFPQFYNVLKGDMSLVGTRPPTVDEWEKYSLHHRARLSAKPGITGIWQVSGRSNITDFEEIVQLDRQYISEWSIGLDLKMLLKTVSVVLSRDGSI